MLFSFVTLQPVTLEEVEKAAKINPLAASLIAPPDPEILQKLSVDDAKKYMAEHAQTVLLQPSSQRTTRRRGSLDDTDITKEQPKGE